MSEGRVQVRAISKDGQPSELDAAVGTNLRPRESWAAFRRLPLTEAEFNQIARNVAPYLG